MILSIFCVNLCVTPHVHASLPAVCRKWPAVQWYRYLLTRRVTQLLVAVLHCYLSTRSAGSLTAQTLNSLAGQYVSLSRTLHDSIDGCRPRAVIGRQRLSLRSSRQWARTAHYDDRPGFERWRRAPERRRRVRTPKRPVRNDVAVQSDGTVRNSVAVPYNGVDAQPAHRHRRLAVGVAAGPTHRQPSHRRRQRSTPLCLLCCACCSALGDCFSSLCSAPFSVKSPVGHSTQIPLFHHTPRLHSTQGCFCI